MENLIRFINKYAQLTKKEEEILDKFVELEYFKKNEFILKEGQKCNKVWFIQSGLVRKFYLADGKEITSWIHCENDMFTSLTSYFQQVPSKECIQACEDCELFSITHTNSQQLSQYPQFEKFSRLLIEDQFSKIDLVSKKFSLMTSVEKYDMLRKFAPEMIKRAKLGHIASIMGISQETLSRIRSKK